MHLWHRKVMAPSSFEFTNHFVGHHIQRIRVNIQRPETMMSKRFTNNVASRIEVLGVHIIEHLSTRDKSYQFLWIGKVRAVGVLLDEILHEEGVGVEKKSLKRSRYRNAGCLFYAERTAWWDPNRVIQVAVQFINFGHFISLQGYHDSWGSADDASHRLSRRLGLSASMLSTQQSASKPPDCARCGGNSLAPPAATDSSEHVTLSYPSRSCCYWLSSWTTADRQRSCAYVSCWGGTMTWSVHVYTF